MKTDEDQSSSFRKDLKPKNLAKKNNRKTILEFSDDKDMVYDAFESRIFPIKKLKVYVLQTFTILI